MKRLRGFRRGASRRQTALPPADFAVEESGGHPWRDLCADSALRMIDLAQQMATTLTAAMQDQADPDVLDRLYAMDALAGRSRRYAEALHVLSGRLLLDTDRQVTSIADVFHAALAGIVGWQRVTMGRVAEIAVAEDVSGDLIRAIAELLDNAVRYSPPDAPVTASGYLLRDGGVLLRIDDTGVGITPAALARYNAILQSPTTATPLTTRGCVQQGLQVVHRTLRRHGIETMLTARTPQGTTAQVYLPAGVLCEIPDDPASANGSHPTAPHRLKAPGPARPGPGFGGAPPPAFAARGQASPAQLPVRVPRPLRAAGTVPPDLARMHPAAAVPPAQGVEDFVAFDTATATPAVDPEGRLHGQP